MVFIFKDLTVAVFQWLEWCSTWDMRRYRIIDFFRLLLPSASKERSYIIFPLCVLNCHPMPAALSYSLFNVAIRYSLWPELSSLWLLSTTLWPSTRPYVVHKLHVLTVTNTIRAVTIPSAVNKSNLLLPAPASLQKAPSQLLKIHFCFNFFLKILTVSFDISSHVATRVSIFPVIPAVARSPNVVTFWRGQGRRAENLVVYVEGYNTSTINYVVESSQPNVNEEEHSGLALKVPTWKRRMQYVLPQSTKLETIF